MIFWTPDREEQLRQLADGTRTASQIASAIGCARKAVIGKVLRGNGRFGRLQGRKVSAAGIEAKREKRSARVPAARPAITSARPVIAPAPDLSPATVPAIAFGATETTFARAVDAGLCLHFVGDPYGPDGPDMPVCGAARSAGRWCERHAHSLRERRAA